MAYPPYLRAKAIELRVARRLSLDEIAERLALPKTTVWYWIRDIPLQRSRKPQHVAAAARNVAHFAALRDAAYQRGMQSWPILSADPGFRDFVTLYIAEGSKRNRNHVSVANSDPAVMALSVRWLRRLTHKPLTFSLQFHADQDLDELRAFWGGRLGFDGSTIRFQRKSNSGQLAGRSWRSQYGVLTVTVHDTYLRSRIEAWMACIKAVGRRLFEPTGRGAAW